MTAITVGVVGALGRMGRSICAAVAADDALELVAAIDPKGGAETVSGVLVAPGLEHLAEVRPSVVIDFTVLDAAAPYALRPIAFPNRSMLGPFVP